MLIWLLLNGLLLLLAYLLGALAFGYWTGKLLKGIDIREHGSGSTGATNVLRTLGTVPAIAVLAADILKGVGAILLVQWAYAQPWLQALAPTPETMAIWQPWIVVLVGMAALLGHSKSIFLGFSGGKSVATSLGLLLAMNWMVGLGTLAVFLVAIGLSRIVSLSSICGAIAASGLMVALGQPLPYVLFAIAGGAYVIVRHRSNIQRLLNGSEPKLGQKLPEPTLETSEQSPVP
jgi:acyl phosphate:glycerol-3-phosphate acyltransferase